MCQPRVGAANPLFSLYGERSDVPQLQQVEQKAIGRQRNFRLLSNIIKTLPLYKTNGIENKLYIVITHKSHQGNKKGKTCHVLVTVSVTGKMKSTKPHYKPDIILLSTWYKWSNAYSDNFIKTVAFATMICLQRKN
jgi:hypothetical protein